jgi:hypothetical protein
VQFIFPPDGRTVSRQAFLLLLVMALVGVAPVLLFIASLGRWTVGEAHRKSLHWLGSWGGLAPRALSRRLALLSALSLVLAVLFGMAVFLKTEGAEAMPQVSKLVGYFGERGTAWTVEHRDDWERFRNDFRAAWSRRHLGSDLEHAGDVWEDWLYDHGLRGIHAAAILFLYGALVLLAGAVDVLNSGIRRRGSALVLLGLLSLLFFTWVWVVSQAHLVDAVLQANAGLGKDAVRVPSTRTVMGHH